MLPLQGFNIEDIPCLLAAVVRISLLHLNRIANGKEMLRQRVFVVVVVVVVVTHFKPN